jgi:hypothetical protein
MALDVRFAGRELYGRRPRAVAGWSREAGAPVLLKTDRPRVSVEEHMANYQAARALMGKGNSELRNSSRAGQQRKEGRREVRGEEGETKEK